MAEAQERSGERPKVFISYSRADGSTLADELELGLPIAGFEPYLDKHNIEKGVDWEERLGALILKADTVVFIISPASVGSPRCRWEVDRTIKLGKRLIPVQWIRVDESEVPERLRRLNYTIFAAGQSFARPLAELATALRQDVEWIREHTLLGEQAARWKARGQAEHADDLLLRGSEMANARAWIARRSDDAPDITDLQRAFLSASETAEQARIGAERQRLAERERLVKEAEAAQARTARAQSWATWTLVTFAVVVAVGLSFISWQHRTNVAQKLALDRGRISFLAELSGAAKLRGSLVSALRFATLAGSLELSLDQREIASSPARAALAAVVSQSGWRLNLAGHESYVASAAFSPDGSRIVTASGDKTARIWDAASGKELTVLRGHENNVSSAAFSPEGSRIVTASGDKTARIWDASSGKEFTVLHGHENYVMSAAFSPDGSRIVTASGDKTARIWDASSGKELTVLRGHESGVSSAAFSPEGSRIVTASWDKTARILDAASGKEITVLRGHEGGVLSAAFSPDGSRIVTASSDKTARIWDARFAMMSAKDLVWSKNWKGGRTCSS
jgi:predicted oxidoreductase (fatty acid repression mutant protein)